MVTITVHRGLNIAEKSGPLLDMTHAWTKNESPDPIPPCSYNVPVSTIKIMSIFNSINYYLKWTIKMNILLKTNYVLKNVLSI